MKAPPGALQGAGLGTSICNDAWYWKSLFVALEKKDLVPDPSTSESSAEQGHISFVRVN